ncbi:MAG: hypothetical protein Fur0037_18250 [Planctomycetota bacterium]
MTGPSFRVLIHHGEILRRTRELAREIAASRRPYCLVAVMEGARTFARALRGFLPGAPMVHELRASSYGNGTTSSGSVKILTGHDIPVESRDVLVIEDIVDTGRTVAALREHLLASGARSVRVVTLLNKPSRRVVQVELHHVGFEIPDLFVLGYGMDLAGKYRDLPDIVVCERTAAGN